MWRSGLTDYIREQAQPPDKFSHQPRLYALTREIGEGLSYNDDVVFAAAWLHDLGVFTGHRPSDGAALAAWDACAYSMRETPEILTRIGFPPEQISAVVECIRTHEAKNSPITLEGRILQDADILEQLGAIGILRATCKVGRDTRYHTFADILPVLQSALDTLPPKLHLESSRGLARRRMELLRELLAAAQSESQGILR